MKIPKELKEIFDSLKFDESRWYFSITIPVGTSSEELLRFLRSKSPESLEKNELHSQVKNQLRSIISYFHRVIKDELTAIKTGGILITAATNMNEMKTTKLEDIPKLISVHSFKLETKPQKKVVLSHIPDLTFAIEHFSTDEAHLLIAIDPNHSHLYKVAKAGKINLLWKHENEHIKPEHNRYYEKMTITQNQSIRHGTGAEKVNRVLSSGEKLFVKKELASLSKKYTPKKITVLISQRYKSWQKEVDMEINKLFPNIEKFLQVHSSDFFEEISQKVLSSLEILDESGNHSIPEENNPKTLTKLHSISKALKNGRVDTLYLNPKINYHAYVHANADSFTYPVKNTTKVDSIRPWLIKTALESSAKVAVMSEDLDQKQTIATTRY